MADQVCRDELTPIARYISQEMNANAHGDSVRRMHSLNSFSAQGCIDEYIKAPFLQRLFGAITPQQCAKFEITNKQAALLLWTARVMQNAEWDHKPKIASRFASSATGSRYWHVRDDFKYFYDIWSNIHYGYVGRASGFSDAMLLDGAGLEQIGSDLLRGHWPMRSPGINSLRGFDDASDRTAIAIGVKLYRYNAANVTAANVLQEVLSNPDLTREQL